MRKFKSTSDMFRNGQGYIHESMDRLSIIQQNLEDYVIKAPISQHLRLVKAKLEKAQELLAEAYQEIAQYQDLK